MVKIKVPATTANLGPGFDTLGAALALYNHVTMEEIEQGLKINIVGEGANNLSRDEKNLLYQASFITFDKANYKPRGLRILLENHIPMARGLGSSSSAIVGGIFAANELAGSVLSLEEMVDLATELEGHPDNVVPAFYGGFTVSAIAGKNVYAKQFAIPKGLKAVVAIPDFFLSTEDSRQVIPHTIPMKDAAFNVNRVALLVSAIAQQDLSLFEIAMVDKIHQPYRSTLIPGFWETLAAAKENGAIGTAMSGAGPTLIAFAAENFEKIEKAMQRSFESFGVKSVTKTLDFSQKGVEKAD